MQYAQIRGGKQILLCPHNLTYERAMGQWCFLCNSMHELFCFHMSQHTRQQLTATKETKEPRKSCMQIVHALDQNNPYHSHLQMLEKNI
eukprot:739727-Pelagomonas_calceolata.AAC.2